MSLAEAEGELSSLGMKILYTLHGVDSQKFIVKPTEKIESRIYRGINLAILDIEPCLRAMRAESPEFSSICDTHADEYAVYSVDFSEDDLPLQCHGKVSQDSVIEATGKLCSSKLRGEHIEMHVHVLPIRKPAEMLVKAEEDAHTYMEQHQSNQHSQQHQHQHQQPVNQPQIHNQQHISIQNDANGAMMNPFPFLPMLPPPVQIPPSLLRSESQTLPSSPPIRARPTKITPVHPPSHPTRPGKRVHSDAQPAKKRKSTTSPKDEPVSQCRNCGVETASTWRRVEYPEGTKELLCNACALYYKAKHVMRPSVLWDKKSHPQPRQVQQPQPQIQSMSLSQAVVQLAQHMNSQPLPLQASYHDSYPMAQHIQSVPYDNSNAQLWSKEQYFQSEENEISDRLVDNALEVKNDNKDATKDSSEPSSDGQEPVPPSTPNRRAAASETPDSIQKLFDFSTPTQKSTLLLPGSGSTSKWLSKVMNNADFEEFLRSPSIRGGKHPTLPDLGLFTSSPPTSSNLFSEMSDWQPEQPEILKSAVKLDDR